MHYYAFYNRYGVNTRHAADNSRMGLFDPVFDDLITDELVAVYLDFYDEI